MSIDARSRCSFNFPAVLVGGHSALRAHPLLINTNVIIQNLVINSLN